MMSFNRMPTTVAVLRFRWTAFILTIPRQHPESAAWTAATEPLAARR
jgi:hypothetical protein